MRLRLVSFVLLTGCSSGLGDTGTISVGREETSSDQPFESADGGGGTDRIPVDGAGRVSEDEPPETVQPIVEPGVEPVFEQPVECPSFAPQDPRGTVTDGRLNEVSGLVQSRDQNDVLWAHNDSGDGARLFAISERGELRWEVGIQDARAVDWEDMAIGPGAQDGSSFLYVGDFGDNFYERASVTVYRVGEPTVTSENTEPSSVPVDQTYELTYPNGPNNAETLLLDPWTGDLYVVAKKNEGDSILFRKSAPLSSGVMEDLGTLQFGSGALVGSTLTTGGDISADGHWIGIRTYSHAFVWLRQEGESVFEAVARAPCTADPISEVQGETMAFATDGSGYFTLSEQENQPLNFYASR